MAKKTNCVVNGVPKYRYRPKDPDCDQANFYGDSKKDAIRMYTEYMEAKRNSGGRHFGNLFTDWLDVEKKPSLRDSSYNRYESLKRTWVDRAYFYNHPVKEIDSLMIKKFLNAIELEGSKSTAGRVYLLLAAFFDYATGFYIDKNPMSKMSMPKYDPPVTKKYYTPTEVTVIENNLNAPDDFVYLFALHTGLREGEIIALRVKDVDLKSRVIRVNKTLNRVKIDGRNQAVEGPPKTKAGLRDVPISDQLMPLIEKHIFIEKTKFNKLGLKHNGESYFFTGKFGRTLRGDRLNTAWKSAQVRIGIEPLKFHCLRHTCCTRLARARVRLEVAAKILGHDSIETTAGIYVHVDLEDKKEAFEAVNLKLSGDKLAK